MNTSKMRPEILLLSDSLKVKRSKLMGCGIKPKEGFEESLSSLIIDYAKRLFLNKLEDYKLEDLFENEQQSEEFILEKEAIFGETLSTYELFELESVSVQFIIDHSIYIRDQFSDFITDSFSTKEMELLEVAYLFKIYLTLSEFEFKTFFNKFLEYQMNREPYKNWFTITDGLVILRNNITVRELKDYISYSYMLLPLKKINVKNNVLEEIEEYLTEIFLMDIDLPSELEVEQMKKIVNDFLENN